MGDKHFGFTNNASVLENVPLCFLKLGIIFIAIQIFGCFLLKNPNSKKNENQNELLKDEKDVGIADLTECEVLRDFTFWNLWFTFSLNALCLTFFSTEWKNFSNQQL